MLNRTKHEVVMRNILDDVYNHSVLAGKLGFKGGTCCYFFYELPRFSTDLDFNLLDLEKSAEVFEAFKDLLKKHGEIRDEHKKENTLFFYLSHTPEAQGIKIEISTRRIEEINSYETKEFYGTSMLVMVQEDIFANKLLALTHRVSPSARDLFDINYFLSKGWDVNIGLVEKFTGKDFFEYMEELPIFIRESFNRSNIHLGLGELLAGQSERDFVKRKLIDDTVNKLEFFIDSYKRNSV